MAEIPKPPIINMTDFVVFAFVSIVAILLIVSGLTLAILAFTNPDRDTSSSIGALADIVTTLIGALVGFMAGKGTGRQEMHDEIRQMSSPLLPPEPPK